MLSLILFALQSGVSLYTAATGKDGSQANALITAAGEIVTAGTKLYASVKDTLSSTDQATVDSALDAVRTQTGVDVDRVLAEIAADKTA